MLVFELKTYPSKTQQPLIDESIRTTQFIRNKALRKWIDAPKLGYIGEINDKYDFIQNIWIILIEGT